MSRRGTCGACGRGDLQSGMDNCTADVHGSNSSRCKEKYVVAPIGTNAIGKCISEGKIFLYPRSLLERRRAICVAKVDRCR
jgi:hypothetical protein